MSFYAHHENIVFGLAHEMWHAWSSTGTATKIGRYVPELRRQGLGLEQYAVRHTNLIRRELRLPYLRTHYAGIDIGTY